jgi:imidazolonepropionase-like amidohydrolase
MLQFLRRLTCLATFVLAPPSILFAQNSQPGTNIAEAEALAITGATLIDGTGAASQSGTTIIVRDGRIAAVSPDGQAEIPAAARVIDASGRYVIPGLADMHFHLSFGLPQPRQEAETDMVLARALYYGVTTILAIGASDASPESIHSHRARRAAGELEAPYIYGTGGHLTLHGTHPIYTIFPPPVQKAADDLAADIPESEPVDLFSLGIGLSMVRTEDAALKAVRERAAAGMDAIKITVESGPTPFGDDHPQMSVELIRAIVGEAARHDLRVFAHITSLDELQATLEGGAAGVVHMVWDRPFPDAELADRMNARSFYVIPTTTVFRGTVSLYYVDEPIDLDDPFLRETVSDAEVAVLRDPDLLARFRSRWQLPFASVDDRRSAIRLHVDELLANIGMLHERGVPIVLGTDTGTLFSFAGYSVHDELEFLVRAGLTPGEALEAATRRAAEMVDAEDEFGTIEPGKRADLLILGANPLDDIRNTRSLETVIAEGRVVDREALPVRIR